MLFVALYRVVFFAASVALVVSIFLPWFDLAAAMAGADPEAALLFREVEHPMLQPSLLDLYRDGLLGRGDLVFVGAQLIGAVLVATQAVRGGERLGGWAIGIGGILLFCWLIAGGFPSGWVTAVGVSLTGLIVVGLLLLGFSYLVGGIRQRPFLVGVPALLYLAWTFATITSFVYVTSYGAWMALVSAVVLLLGGLRYGTVRTRAVAARLTRPASSRRRTAMLIAFGGLAAAGVAGAAFFFCMRAERPGTTVTLDVEWKNEDTSTRAVTPVVQASGEPGTGPLAVSPDGRWLADAGKAYLDLWDLRDKHKVARLAEFPGYQPGVTNIAAVHFSNDGRYLAWALGRDVTVWSMRESAVVQTIHLDEDVSAFAFDPRGDRIAIGGWESGTVSIWDVSLGERTLAPELAQRGDVGALGWSDDGASLVAGIDRHVWRWDLSEEPRRPHFVGAHEHVHVTDVGFLPDGETILSVSRTAKFWRIQNETLEYELPLEWGTDTGLSRERGILATYYLQRLTLYDTATGKKLGATTPGYGGGVNVAFSAEAEIVVARTMHGEIVVWDRREDPPGERLQLWHRPFDAGGGSVAISPDGSRVAYAGVDDQIHLWDVAAGRAIARPRGSRRSPMCFSADGSRLVTIDGDRVRRWDAATGDSVDGPAIPASTVRCLPDDDAIVTAWRTDDDLTLARWALDDGARLSWIQSKVDCRERRIEIDAEGRVWCPGGEVVRLWSANAPGRIFSLALGARPAALDTPHEAFAVAPVPGDRLATIDPRGEVVLWNLDPPETRRSCASVGPGAPARCKATRIRAWRVPGTPTRASVSPDGRTLATVATDDRLRLWDLETGAEVPTPDAPTMVEELAFSSDGRVVATAGYNAISLYRPEDDTAVTLHTFLFHSIEWEDPDEVAEPRAGISVALSSRGHIASTPAGAPQVRLQVGPATNGASLPANAPALRRDDLVQALFAGVPLVPPDGTAPPSRLTRTEDGAVRVVDRGARPERVCLFAGPVSRDADPEDALACADAGDDELVAPPPNDAAEHWVQVYDRDSIAPAEPLDVSSR